MSRYTIKILVEEERYYKVEGNSIQEFYKDWVEDIEDKEPVETNVISESLEWIRNDNPKKQECIR